MCEQASDHWHPFQSMSLHPVAIPEIQSIKEIAKDRTGGLEIGDLKFGPHASEQISDETAHLVLNFMSANAHNDWLRKKIIVSLSGHDAKGEFDESSKTFNIEKDKKFRATIRKKATGPLKNCLLCVYEDAARLSKIRNLFAHGIFGNATGLDGHFLVFEPDGLTVAHARVTTFDHELLDLFWQGASEEIRKGFQASLPDPTAITVWNEEKLETALEACHWVGRALDVIIESLRPDSTLQAEPTEVHEILAQHGAVSTDLRLYFIMREDYRLALNFRD